MILKSIALSICAGSLVVATSVNSGSHLSTVDKAFLREAAQAEMTAAHEGNMAENQAVAQNVKTFGQKLVQDDSSEYGKLLDLASKTGEKIPRGIDARRNPDIETLARLKGSKFDQTFVRDEIRSLERTLAEYKREAAHGRSDDIKAYANSAIATLESDLHEARQLQETHRGRS